MLKTGLVSISFRKLKPEEIIPLVVKGKLHEIEWGGDIHVPHGDLYQAKKVAKMTEEGGLSVACYGSYYRAGSQREEQPSQQEVLETAQALGAPMIRIWAGDKSSAEMNLSEREHIAQEIRNLTEAADRQGIKISLEYHEHTLTDTDETTDWLLREVNHPALSTLWQPRNGVPTEQNVLAIQRFLPRISNLHVFHWQEQDGRKIRQPLAEGKTVWMQYLKLVSTHSETPSLLLEFVAHDSEEQFLLDAKTLWTWVEELGKGSRTTVPVSYQHSTAARS